LVVVSVGRAEVLGLHAKDLHHCSLQLLKLLRDAFVAELGDVGVGPCVRADNVTLLVEVAKRVNVLLVVDTTVVVTLVVSTC
jgi:hypothetical protein